MASTEKQSPSAAPYASATGFASLFTFKSFRSRLVVFLLCLLLPVLGGIFYYVNQNKEEYTEETINTYLELGANVFDFTRQQQAYTLEAITAASPGTLAFAQPTLLMTLRPFLMQP